MYVLPCTIGTLSNAEVASQRASELWFYDRPIIFRANPANPNNLAEECEKLINPE